MHFIPNNTPTPYPKKHFLSFTHKNMVLGRQYYPSIIANAYFKAIISIRNKFNAISNRIPRGLNYLVLAFMATIFYGFVDSNLSVNGKAIQQNCKII